MIETCHQLMLYTVLLFLDMLNSLTAERQVVVDAAEDAEES